LTASGTGQLDVERQIRVGLTSSIDPGAMTVIGREGALYHSVDDGQPAPT